MKRAAWNQEISGFFQVGYVGPVEESQTHTTRSVGSNPTNKVDLSVAEFASEVGDGGGGAVPPK